MLVDDSPYQVCTILANPGADSVHLISNAATSFPLAILDRLKEFLHQEFSPSNSQPQPGDEDLDLGDGGLENAAEVAAVEEDFLQEIATLEKGIDDNAEDDPDVQALQQEESTEDGGQEHGGEATPEGGAGQLHEPVVGQHCASHGADFVASELSGSDSDGSTLLPPKLLLKGLKRKAAIGSGDEFLVGSELSPPVAEPATSCSKKLRMDYVLAPPRKKGSACAPSALPPGAPSLSVVEEERRMRLFMLDEEQRKACAAPKNFMLDAEEGFKYTFGVDLSKVPGRTRKWSKIHGMACFVVRPLVPQEANAAPALNLLQQDPDLSAIGCAYLPDYDVIICQNILDGKLCSQAIPLDRLMVHCYKRRGAGESGHEISSCKRVNGKITLAQRLLVARLLARYPNVVVTFYELKDLRPIPNQFGPIAHVRPPVEGFACNHCDAACSKGPYATRFFKEHWDTHIRLESLDPCQKLKTSTVLQSDKVQPCMVQTLNATNDAITWFKVPGSHPSQLRGIQARSPASPQTMGAIIAASLASSSPSTAVNRSLLLPFFREVRAAEFIQRIEPSLAEELISLPTRCEKDLFKLKTHCIRVFRQSCASIRDAPILVQEALVKTRDGSHQMTRQFQPPTKFSTVGAYALEETRLLCFVLRCIGRGLVRSNAKSPWDGSDFYLALTSGQIECFQQLLACLQNPGSSEVALTKAVKDALKTLYMQSNTFEMLAHPFICTAVVYICLRSIHPDGGFRDPRLLTPFYAKTQFGTRLYLLTEASNIYSEYAGQPGTSEEKYQRYKKWLEDFTSTWALEDNQVSPLSLIRRWIRALSRIARVTPTATCILWDTTHSSLSVKGHVISMDAYRACVRSTLKNLEDFVNHRVLLEVQLPHQADLLPREESGDLDTRGYGLFTPSEEELMSGDHPSSIFLAGLCESGAICQLNNGILQWDSKKLGIWVNDVAEAWMKTLVLLHLLSLPARGTEETAWQHSNSPSSPRHLFLSPHLKTLVTQSNYSKTTVLTGVYKYVVRPIPYALARVIGVLLWTVRPIEAMAVLSHTSLLEKENIQENYATYMFVAAGKLWDSVKFSAALKLWYMENMGVPFGLNLHRHFAQALQRKFHSHRSKGQELLGQVANRGLGHSLEAGDMNYAREPADLSLGVSERQRFEEVGIEWIKWHGIEVSPS